MSASTARFAASMPVDLTAGPDSRELIDSLVREVDRLALENQRLAARHVAEEQRASDLMKLLLALRRLHESLDRAQLLAAIEDVIVNVLGSDELAIFTVDESGEALVVARSLGVDASRLANIRLGDGPMRRVFGGQLRLSGDVPGEPIACVPLMLGRSVVGAIVVFGLLEHKTDLDALDLELLDLLAVHGGAALAFTTNRGAQRSFA
jgi:hypothetical protein